jgi:hypothetical protein
LLLPTRLPGEAETNWRIIPGCRFEPGQSTQGPAARSSSHPHKISVAAFGFLAADSRRLQRFLEVSGIELAALREAAREPDFLAGVLDHLCGEEELLVGFSRESGIEPNRVLAARDALHGYGWEHDTP